MEVKAGRMISLGYGKYWRSDAIVGLMPIEEERGPGRRTAVYTAGLEDPIVVSRSERAILQDMAFATDEAFRIEEARETLADLLDAVDDMPDVLTRMLATEAKFDVDAWSKRIRAVLRTDLKTKSPEEQNELFG